MKLYHGTLKSNLEKILRDGLNPLCSKSSSVAVYLTDCKFTAENYCHMHGVEAPDFVVLSVDTETLDLSLMSVDDYELPDIVGDKWESMDWKQSLQECSQCCYNGFIEANKLTIED